jgi:nucleotide-binding universal stress UspA family protein
VYVNYKKQMMEQVSILIKKYPSLNITWKIEHGDPCGKIITCANTRKSSVIVMGTTGRNVVSRTLLGHTASAVAKYAACPVLMIPPNTMPKDQIKLALATVHDIKDLQHIHSLIPLAKLLDAELMFVHVRDRDIDYWMHTYPQLTAELRKQIKYRKISIHIQPGSDVAGALRNFIRKEKPAILSLLSTDRSDLEQLWKPTATQRLYTHMSIPLLVSGAAKLQAMKLKRHEENGNEIFNNSKGSPVKSTVH